MSSSDHRQDGSVAVGEIDNIARRGPSFVRYKQTKATVPARGKPDSNLDSSHLSPV